MTPKPESQTDLSLLRAWVTPISGPMSDAMLVELHELLEEGARTCRIVPPYRRVAG